MGAIELEEVRKEFGSLLAVDDVSLSVQEGELLCLLGPSGCGKTTTLRMIGGLEATTAGSIHIDGVDVTETPAYTRNTSIVFQQWALFPTKSVVENVAFGLKMDGVPKAERRERARELLERMRLERFAESSPGDLSGGQQQRVALARSLAKDPDLLLLDEPLSNLDKRLREDMQIELKEVHREFEKTMIYVTHDQDEAFTLADRIGIMNDGRLVQVGDPREVYGNPKNQFVEEFLGDTNVVPGTVADVTDGVATVEMVVGTSVRLESAGRLAPGDEVTVSVRPEVVDLGTPLADGRRRATDGGFAIEGAIEEVLYRGSRVRYYVDASGHRLFVEKGIADGAELEGGTAVELRIDEGDLFVFDAEGRRVD